MSLPKPIPDCDLDKRLKQLQRHWGVCPNGCIEWTGHRTGPMRYGRLWVGDKSFAAHRVSYRVFVGPIPPGMLVCHRCDNPACIKPDHLFLGTYLDNNRDAKAKGRRPKGEKHGIAKLTDEAVLDIRANCRPVRGHGMKLFGRKYGVSKTTIRRVIRRIDWTHI